MQISYDVDKQSRTFLERGLDFEDSLLVFKGRTFEFLDDRRDYGDRRVICVGELMGRMVIVGYVQRGSMRHVFSMRKANEREQAAYRQRLEQSGRSSTFR